MNTNIDYNMAHGIAKNYVQAHYYQYLNGHREQLITAIANHLKLTGYPIDVGTKVAIKEIAQFESDMCHAIVDIDRSNSSLIVIQHRNKRLYFTVQDLIDNANMLTARSITQ